VYRPFPATGAVRTHVPFHVPVIPLAAGAAALAGAEAGGETGDDAAADGGALAAREAAPPLAGAPLGGLAGADRAGLAPPAHAAAMMARTMVAIARPHVLGRIADPPEGYGICRPRTAA